jgi:adenylosuccinate lyase
MAAVWSDQRRLEAWKDVEVLVVEAWAERGRAPREAAEQARAAPVPTSEQVIEREKVTDHDVAAFVDVLAASLPSGGEWIHFGLTSSDVLDTAGAVILTEATDLLLDATAELFESIRRQAERHRETAMVGRTHGIWAEPTSFGLKLAGWAFEVARDHERLRAARRRIAIGKVSGAVGTYAHAPAEIEAYVCSRLGLTPEPAATQVVARDRHAEFLSTLALCGASLERFATEIRHLQRSEVGEVREPFRLGQKGSSAMPHKRNPIISERITGLARVLRGYAQVGLENVALWHERDISHSGAERIVLPDACLTLYYMLVKFRSLVEGLEVDESRMRLNLDQTRGLVFSQAFLLALVNAGLSRADAYRIVQENALRAMDGEGALPQLLAKDERVPLDTADLESRVTAEQYLSAAGVVFERLAALTLDGGNTS